MLTARSGQEKEVLDFARDCEPGSACLHSRTSMGTSVLAFWGLGILPMSGFRASSVWDLVKELSVWIFALLLK